MRKLLILALIAVAALVVMAGNADYTRDPDAENYFEDVTEEGNVEVYVHQWLNLSVTRDGEIDIYDYDTQYSDDVGDVSIESNAAVSVSGSVSGSGADLVSDLKLGDTTILDTSEDFDGGDYDLFLHVQAGQDVSASSYTVHITLTFNPTVTL